MSTVKEVIKVDGMSCAACSARIEKALKKDQGVSESYANFTNNTVSVTYDDEITDRVRISALIQGAGYDVIGEGGEAPDRSRRFRIIRRMPLLFPYSFIKIKGGFTCRSRSSVST